MHSIKPFFVSLVTYDVTTEFFQICPKLMQRPINCLSIIYFTFANSIENQFRHKIKRFSNFKKKINFYIVITWNSLKMKNTKETMAGGKRHDCLPFRGSCPAWGEIFCAKSSFMTWNVAKSRMMSAAIGRQPWDAGPLEAMKVLESDNPGFDP